MIKDVKVFLCADYQNGLRARAGGPTAGRAFVQVDLCSETTTHGRLAKTLEQDFLKPKTVHTPAYGILVDSAAATYAADVTFFHMVFISGTRWIGHVVLLC